MSTHFANSVCQVTSVGTGQDQVPACQQVYNSCSETGVQEVKEVKELWIYPDSSRPCCSSNRTSSRVKVSSNLAKVPSSRGRASAPTSPAPLTTLLLPEPRQERCPSREEITVENLEEEGRRPRDLCRAGRRRRSSKNSTKVGERR